MLTGTISPALLESVTGGRQHMGTPGAVNLNQVTDNLNASLAQETSRRQQEQRSKELFEYRPAIVDGPRGPGLGFCNAFQCLRL